MSVVKEIRKRVGMTQLELAISLGVHISTVQNWEHNGVNVNGYKKLFSLTPDDMLEQLLQEVVR